MRSEEPTRVREIMSSPVETISRDATVSDAAAKMRDDNINALIVTTSTPSIITSTDILDAVASGEDTSELDATALTTEPVETIPPELQIGEAAVMMSNFEIKHLPVVDGGGYVGMISSTDIAAQVS
ncbi:MAG: signal-transduction protein with cAMP-binding, CBS, and nucleotidyltransferase domain [Natronomonas sp.]|jgi:signal-transduction protein with cAMP-binding, CBS, and nucleotidyltransferase domain